MGQEAHLQNCRSPFPVYWGLALFFCLFFFLSLSLSFFFFLGPHPQHMEVPRPGVKLERQLPATATAVQDPDQVCNLYHSSWQCRTHNPLSKARDWTRVLLDTSQLCYRWAMKGTPKTCPFKVNSECSWIPEAPSESTCNISLTSFPCRGWEGREACLLHLCDGWGTPWRQWPPPFLLIMN